MIRSGLTGVAAAQALLLVVKRLAELSPAVWGWGRCPWCIGAIALLMSGLMGTTELRAQDWLMHLDVPGVAAEVAFQAMHQQTYGEVA